MVTPENSEWSAEQIEQARQIFAPKVHESQMERVLSMAAQVAAESGWSLVYTAQQVVNIMIDKPEKRTVINLEWR